jgi:alkylation response protein AidB-like acyl-CoA dehydrogenase
MTTSDVELAELRDALRRALGVDPDAVPDVDPAWRTRWPELAGIGLLAFCATEATGGFGNEAGAALVAARELGAALHGAPYAAAVAATYALARAPRLTDAVAMVEAALAGEHLPVLAFLDPGAEIAAGGRAVRLTGRARVVAGVGEFDSLVLVPSDRAGLLLVERGDGCTVERLDAFDVTRTCGDVAFEGATVREADVPPEVRERAERLHGLLLAGDALGGADALHARTTAYANERKAFGRAIGGFQAVQHRLVDHAVRLRGLDLLAKDAADRLTTGAPDAGRQALLAEAGAARHTLAVLHDLLQLTGAIGFTWEYGLHLYERRAHLDARLGRNPRQALRALAVSEGW